MAAGNEAKSVSSAKDKNSTSRKRKHRYLPQNKPVKKKGAYPLRPGVQGFFITCDGGRERQASHEALNVIDSFFEELLYKDYEKDSGTKHVELPKKPLNKKIKFSDSDSSSDEGSGHDNEDEVVDERSVSETLENDNARLENAKTDMSEPPKKDDLSDENQKNNRNNNCKNASDHGSPTTEGEQLPTKKQVAEKNESKCVPRERVEEKSIDRLIEAELEELGDKNKRRFFNLDSGCNGVVFIQMQKKDGEPGPTDVAQHIMTSSASTKKHLSRFMLRVLPIEVACYASEEEISRSMLPLVAQYFPADSQRPQKFAVLYEARANTGIDRMKIINIVAKSVPGPHKVDLSNPDKTIVVEICRTICLIGVVERYKELSKYNLRQLTSIKS